MAPRSIENPTLIERFVSLIPLPYPLAALIWSAILPGSPGFYAIQYLTTGTITLSLANLANALLNLLLPLYLFLIVRYMRLRVVAAETPIAARLSGGEQEYHQAFGRITWTVPAILLTATLGTLLLVSYAFSGMLAGGPLLIIFNIILVYLNTLAFSTYLWDSQQQALDCTSSGAHH